MVTIEELENADLDLLGQRTKIEAIYTGTDSILKTISDRIIPILKGQIKLNDKERALLDTYYRMFAWLRSLVLLNSNVHFQAVAAAARSLYELFVDIKLLSTDKTGSSIVKFNAFPEIEKYYKAKKLVNFCAKQTGATKIDDTIQKNHINSPGKVLKIEQQVISLYGKTKSGKPNIPQHWSGSNLADRINGLDADTKDLYYKTYSILSWYLHSGSTGYTGQKEDHIGNVFGFCHSIAQQVYLTATIVICKEFKLDLALDSFYSIIDDLKLTPGKVIVAEQIKAIESLKVK